MNNHCWDTQIFKSQEGQSLHRGYLAKYYINQGPIFDWMVTGLLFGYRNMKYVVHIIYCFIKTEAQIPWQQKIHLQSTKWTNMKDAYGEILQCK